VSKFTLALVGVTLLVTGLGARGAETSTEVGAQADPRLVASSANDLAKLEQVQLPSRASIAKALLAQMLALPSTTEPMSPATGSARARLLQDRKADVLRDWQAWYDPEWLSARTLAAGLSPLSEKVAGSDCFGAALSGPWGVGYLRVTYRQYFVAILPASPAAFSTPAEDLREFSPEEAARLDALDRERYRVTTVVIHNLGERVGPEGWLGDAGLPLLAGVLAEKTALTAAQQDMVNQGLSIAHTILRGKQLTRRHWRVYDLEFGLLAETVLTFRPPPGTDYLQQVTDGYFVRFFHDGTTVYLAISRERDVFRSGHMFPQLPEYQPDWLSLGTVSPSSDGNPCPTCPDTGEAAPALPLN
jgi:hypothetical protein